MLSQPNLLIFSKSEFRSPLWLPSYILLLLNELSPASIYLLAYYYSTNLNSLRSPFEISVILRYLLPWNFIFKSLWKLMLYGMAWLFFSKVKDFNWVKLTEREARVTPSSELLIYFKFWWRLYPCNVMKHKKLSVKLKKAVSFEVFYSDYQVCSTHRYIKRIE